MRAALKATAVVVLLLAGLLSGTFGRTWDTVTTWAGTNATAFDGGPQAAGTPSDATSYTFNSTTDAGAPVTWNACATIPVVVNPAGAPAGALEDLQAAIDQVNAASGLSFTYQGTTDLTPTPTWGEDKIDGYDEWPPVLVAWVTPDTGLLDADNGGRAYDLNVGASYVSALVVFNSDLDANRAPGFGTTGSRGALYLHELSHVAGLGHVEDQRQIMNPNAAFMTNLGAGDLAGLAAVGSQPCVAAPSPPW